MGRAELRPHVDIEVDLSPSDAAARLEAALSTPGCPVVGAVRGTHAQVMAPPQERHLWSAWLDFELVDNGRGGTTLAGRFGPHPSVWTSYMAAHAVIGILALGLGFFGVAQQMAKEAPIAWWGLPVLAALWLVVWALPFAGQRLTLEEMERLRAFLLSVYASSG